MSVVVSVRIPRWVKEKLEERGVNVAELVREKLLEEALRIEEEELARLLDEIKRDLEDRVNPRELAQIVVEERGRR